MPRKRFLASALALALTGTAAQAQQFTDVVVFGDSLSDAGHYAVVGVPGAQGSFTTNPDPTWAELVSQNFGYSGAPWLAGGSNYAWGGAPTSAPFVCVPVTLPCRNVATQFTDYLTPRGGVADPNALYTYWAGANNIFNALAVPATAQATTITSAQIAVGQIGALQAAGANTIVVLNLPDIGMTPAFRGTANQASLSALSLFYNQTLDAGLATLDVGIVPINVFGLVNEVLANPTSFGFTNVTGTACNIAVLPGGSSLFCSPATYVSPTANQTFLFADGVHPSGAAHAMLANVVVATLAAPGIVSLAPEAGVRLQESHAQAMDTAMFAADGGGEFQGFADLSFGQSEIEGNAWHPGTDGDATTFTLGGTFHPSDRAKVGLGVSISSYDTDLNGAGGIDGTGVLASIGGEYSFDVAYLSGSLFGGTTRAEISRSIQIGLVNRVESGETSMSQHGASLGAGLRFGNDSFRHGPFASVTWHRISVAGYDEDGDLSTAMNYEDFDRDSVVGRIGYQLRGNLGGDRSMSPYLRVAYAMETEDQATVVNAGSNSMNGRFELPGFTPSEDWIEADLGLSMQFGENTVGALSYRGTFADDQVENGSFNLTVSTNF